MRKRLHSESKRGRHCDGPVRTSSAESSRKAQLLKGAGVAAQKRLEGLGSGRDLKGQQGAWRSWIKLGAGIALAKALH